MRAADLFAVAFVRAVDSAATSFGYRVPQAQQVADWLAALPDPTRELIGRGIESGIVLVDGWTFNLTGLPAGKGPYALFSRNRGPGIPSPNWEYFFQIAEFVRVREALADSLTVGFEDGLMDVSVRRDGHLLWYVEVKPRASQIAPLLLAMNSYALAVPLEQADRGNDPLRKAKYLVRHRPPSVSIVGGEERRHFDVRYGADNFSLVERGDGPEVALRS
jgi:hypothetical protein